MRYIALLRGINVGKNGRIRMDALKQLMEQAGFSHVETYIQSGNVLFDSDLAETNAKETIERALQYGANISSTAVLRTADELHALISDCPFSKQQIDEAQAVYPESESFYVCLLPHAPDIQSLEKLKKLDPNGDLYVVSGRNIYLLLRRGIRESKLAIQLQRMFGDMTVRNWNTMTKLDELSRN